MKATGFLLALLATTTLASAGDDFAQMQAKIQQLEEQLQQLKQLQQQLQDKMAEQGAQPVQPQSPASKVFQYRMATLRGATLQPAAGLQPAPGLQPSAADHGGAAPAVTRPMTDEQWHLLFPVKNGAK